MENMTIEVGMKCRQVTIIEDYGFNYVGSEFKITKVTDRTIMGRGLDVGVGFGIGKDEFSTYFELVQEPQAEQYDSKELVEQEPVDDAEDTGDNWEDEDEDEDDYFGDDDDQDNQEEDSDDDHLEEGIIAKVITSGRAVIVILDDGCKGVAKCLPEDEYDFEIGYEIALAKALIKSLTKRLKWLSR